MKWLLRFLKVLPTALVLAPILYVAAKITLFNPVWMIGVRYPSAKCEFHSINSPGPYLWPMFAGLFGIRMDDPDHSFIVRVESHRKPLRLDAFAKADELYVSNSPIKDLSASLEPSARLSVVVFMDCDFTSLPQDQRDRLKSYSEEYPNWYYIPYQEMRMLRKFPKGR